MDSFRRWGLRGHGRYESLISTQSVRVYLLQEWAGRGFPPPVGGAPCTVILRVGRKAIKTVLCTKLEVWTLHDMKAIVLVGSESVHEGSHPTWASPTAEGWKTSDVSFWI